MTIKTQLQQNNSELREHHEYIPTMPTADEARNGQYTWHKYSVVDGAKGQSIGFVVDDSEKAYPIDGIHTDGFYYVLYGAPFPIVSWADGTDEEIVAMIQAADEGKINLSDYWAVGQERKVTLSAMSAMSSSSLDGLTDSHEQQEVVFVLMNKGGKELVNATESGRTECSFVVGMKYCLERIGKIIAENDSLDGWKNTKRRTWCNSKFKDSIPSTLIPIFKQHKNITANRMDGRVVSNDWFAFPAEKEVFGVTKNASSVVEEELVQFEWYKTTSNRIKKLGISGDNYIWWTRSQAKGYDRMCTVFRDGTNRVDEDYGYFGLSPFGCI